MRLYAADERRLSGISGLLVLLPTLILLHFRHLDSVILRIALIALRTPNNRAAFPKVLFCLPHLNQTRNFGHRE